MPFVTLHWKPALKGFPDDPLLGVRATILLRIDWLSGLIGALLW